MNKSSPFGIDSQLMIVSKHFGKGDKSDNFLLKRPQQILIKSEHSGHNLNRIGVIAEVAKVIRIKLKAHRKLNLTEQVRGQFTIREAVHRHIDRDLRRPQRLYLSSFQVRLRR